MKPRNQIQPSIHPSIHFIQLSIHPTIQPSTPMIHRRSKISRLPEPIITQINEFLDANVEYARILKWLRQSDSSVDHPGTAAPNRT